MEEMIIDECNRFIFFALPKTGTTSLEVAMANIGKHETARKPFRNEFFVGDRALRIRPGCRRHMKPRELRILHPGIFASCHKVAFVRNPWDRLISIYFFTTEKRYGFPPMEKLSKRAIRAAVRDYRDGIGARKVGGKRVGGYQIDWLSGGEGKILVDRVCRFEKIEEEYVSLMKLTGYVSRRLPRVNNTTHRNYRSYYTSETRALVRRLLAVDIEAFGYCF